MPITDLQKYLSKFMALLSKKYDDTYQYVSPIIADMFEKTKEHKEIVIKAIIPFSVIALGFYTCTSSHHTVSQNIADIFEISDEIRNYYTGKPDYWGLSTQTVIKETYIPKKFIKDEKIIISGGKELLIGEGANADTIMPRTTSFDVVLPHLNKAQCIAHAEASISEENQVKLLRISIINPLGEYSFEWGNGKYKLPIARYASKNVCADSDNTLIWSLK